MVSTFCAHIFALIFWCPYFALIFGQLYLDKYFGKLYVFPIESAFEYLHHSKPENHSSVTFSENRKSMMSYHRDFPEEMSHQIAIVFKSYHGRVILTTNQNRHNFASQL